MKSYQTLENELVDVHMKNSGAQERISLLEQQLDEANRRYARELAEIKQTNTSLQGELSQKRVELSSASVKSDTLAADCVRLKSELSRAEVAHRQRAEALERELAEVKSAAAKTVQQQRSEYESMMGKRQAVVESGEKFEAEIKVLNGQITSLVRTFYYFKNT